MSKRYVAIWFLHLKTDWMSRHNSQLKTIPFALVYPDHGRMRITEVNALAKAEGIEAGMVVADAKVILPSLEIKEDNPDLSKRILRMLCAWTIRYTPAASIDFSDGLMLDVTGCAHLWNGETTYLKEMVNKLNKLGYHLRAAMADTIGTAWAISRYGKTRAIINPDEQKQALLSLPPAALRLEISLLVRLRKLGFYTIGSFIDMERSVLRRRFGNQLPENLDKALGYSEEVIEPLIPLEPFEERLPCLEPIQTRKGIEIALDRLLEMLCNRLKQEEKGIRTAVFKGFRIDGITEQMTISTNKPSINISHLYKLFEIHIAGLTPASGIELFSLSATKVQDLATVQQALWSPARRLESEELAQLLDRIQTKYGRESIQRYLPAEHHLPERSVKPATSLEEKPEIAWRTERRRPIALLVRPEKILVTAPIPDYPPMNFNYQGKLHKVIKADGPERIEPEWWLEPGQHRDYYVVEDEEGKRYWLYRLGHFDEKEKPDWFMHGFFP